MGPRSNNVIVDLLGGRGRTCCTKPLHLGSYDLSLAAGQERGVCRGFPPAEIALSTHMASA